MTSASTGIEANIESARRTIRIWSGVGLAVGIATITFQGWLWLHRPSRQIDGENAKQATAPARQEPIQPPPELPARLSCASAESAITRWEDGTVYYDFTTRPAMIAVPAESKIIAGTFDRTSSSSGTFNVQGVLNTSTNQLTKASDVVHLEVVAVNAKGVLTVRIDADRLFCVADAGSPPASQEEKLPEAKPADPDAAAGGAPERSDAPLGDRAAIAYVEELPWIHQGNCEMLYQTARRMVGTGLPYEIQMRQVDSIINKAIDVGCISQ